MSGSNDWLTPSSDGGGGIGERLRNTEQRRPK